MRILKNTLSQGLLAGGLLLAGDALAETPAAVPASGLAETLGLPVGGAKYHFWNQATQTSGALGCEAPSNTVVECRLDISSAGAQKDYSLAFTLGQETPEAAISVQTSTLGSSDWSGDYRRTTDYKNFYDMSELREWTENSPLAQMTPVGVLQNDIRKVELKDSSVSLSSDVPVSENFGIGLTHVFDHTSGKLETSAMLRIFAGNSVLEIEGQPAQRGLTSEDVEIAQRNADFAKQAGGTGYRPVVSQKP